MSTLTSRPLWAQIRVIAGKEFHDRIRNRWVLAISIVFAAFTLAISYFGAAAQGAVGFHGIEPLIASLVSLAIYLLPLIALILGFDALVGERERGTLNLLLSYPLTRTELLVGKYVGLAAALTCATLAGFGAAGAVIAARMSAADWYQYAGFVLSAVLLGWVFLSLAVCASAFCASRTSASGVAIALWFCFVLVYDLLLLGALVLTGGAGLGHAAAVAAAQSGRRVPRAEHLRPGRSARDVRRGQRLSRGARVAPVARPGDARVDRGAARPRRLEIQSMKRRFLSAAVRTSIAALAAAALVAACGHDAQTPPPAREITDATVSVLDGMSLKDYPGPKAQIVYADGEPDFFCDTLGLFSVYLRPEHDRKVRALYVQDMGATDWQHPVGHWIDAKRAIYVIGSKKPGAMGRTFASFAREADAARFAKAEGGKLYRFGEITPEMATTDGGVVKDQTM